MNFHDHPKNKAHANPLFAKNTMLSSSAWVTWMANSFQGWICDRWIGSIAQYSRTSISWTRITSTPCWLELNFLSLEKNFTEIYPSNSGSCNSTGMHHISCFCCIIGENNWNHLVLISATNRSRFIIMHKHVTVSDEIT